MVSSIVPGATNAGALAVDARPVDTRPVDARQARAFGQSDLNNDKSASGDRVEVSGPAAWAAARESVAGGLGQVQLALGLARDARTMLLKAQSLAGDPGSSQGDLDAALGDYSSRFNAAVAQGGALISGQGVNVQAEPGGASLMVAGADLALKAEPAPGDPILVSKNASLADRAGLSQTAQQSLDRLQGVMERLGEAQRALEAHQGFLSAAQNAASSVSDLNADGARLLALQVRQGLEGAGAGPIANVEPRAVLALFKV
jgi:hypothetical protein